MAEFNFVSISFDGTDIYFTDTGADDGDPCMTEIPNLDELNNQKMGAVQFSANNTPKIFSAPSVGQGFICRIKAFVVSSTMHQAIWTLLNSMDLNADDRCTVVIEGDIGNFEFDAYPLLPGTTEMPGTFLDGWIDDVTYSFVVTDLK